ncbi:MAG: hypothetical protein PHV51_07215 [Methanosarcinaceae archaeon]|nr:hypothetical protein [Methanosarcinaceae archaeon]MDD4497921.1 hypothetical protein [Methanosarcinaceae archaeon]
MTGISNTGEGRQFQKLRYLLWKFVSKAEWRNPEQPTAHEQNIQGQYGIPPHTRAMGLPASFMYFSILQIIINVSIKKRYWL